ncbi:MAG: hypothetical protein R3212_00010 [Xanthomonadales bacterium]|nr:hypothetical protein [Xanthomonadales bacterium]
MGFVLALAIPSGEGFDQATGINPTNIPLASLMVNIPERVDYIGVYFFVLWILMPILLICLAKNPQRREQFSYTRMELPNAAGATLACLVAVLGLAYFLSMDPLTCADAAARGKALICFAAKYKVGLGLVGGALMLTFAIAVYALFIRVPAMWREYFIQRNP